MRKYARTDKNHSEIVAALRKAGCSVLSLASLGNGAPDILVGRTAYVGHETNYNFLLEVKDSDKPPSARALTPDEQKWQASWRGQVCTVTSVEEALRAVGVMT